RLYVAFHRFRNSFVVDELTFTAAFDEAGVGKRLEVMRNRRLSDSLQRRDVAAIHPVARGDRLVDHEAGLVAKRLRDAFYLFAIHVWRVPFCRHWKLDASE